MLTATRGRSRTVRERGRCRDDARGSTAGADVLPKTIGVALGSKRALLAELIKPAAVRSHVAHTTRHAYAPVVSELELLRLAGAMAPALAELAREVDAWPEPGPADRLYT